MTVETPLQHGYKMLADLTAPLDLDAMFGRSAPVELEIGAGRGDFIIEYAAAQPDLNLIAVERKLVILRKIVSKVQRAGAANVQVLNVEVRHFLREYMRPETLRAVHVYFPDPWPKKRHEHRRLMVAPENIELILSRIEKGGFLHFRTDVPDYFAITKALLDAHAHLQEIAPPAELTRIKTGYENRFERHGVPTYAASYAKA